MRRFKIIISVSYLILALMLIPAVILTAQEIRKEIKVHDSRVLFNEIKSGKINFEFDDPVSVTGYVVDSGISRYATPFAVLSDKPDGEAYAVCVLPRKDFTKLSDIKKGQKISFSGNFYSAREDRIVIKKCGILE